ncbi:MAG TPA: response regulator [Pirellulales bacterium]|nr:response regulator [Pirellulales bacterium]
MDKDALVKQLMATYVEELDDQVRALNRGLLDLEQAPPGAPRVEPLKTLLRAAHSLKGASRSVNVSLIESACHQLEGIFAALQNGKLALSEKLFAELFAAADAIQHAGKSLRRHENIAGEALAAVLPQLETLATGGGEEADRREDPWGIEPVSQPAPVVELLSAAALAAPVPAALPSTQPETPPEPEEPASTLRVPAKKLDALLVQCGEFLVAERRLQDHIQDLEAFSGFAARSRSEWSAAVRPLRSALRLPKSNRNKAFLASPPADSRRLQKLLDRTALNLDRLQNESNRLMSNLVADLHQLQRAAGDLTGQVRQVRMLPFSEACLGLDRMVRDLSGQAGKEVALTVEAGNIELDRSVLEGLKDSLRHLVRNAIHHGVETPEERRASGKPVRGQITITAELRGSLVEVAVADDGRGLDLETLRDVLRKKQVAVPAGERELTRMAFLPGITTEKIVNGVSGRGMGLDIVRTRAEAAHGAVDLSFEAVRGTCVKVSVPLTLTSLRSLLVTAGGQTFGFVGTNVRKVGRIDRKSLKRVDGREMLLLEDELIPIASLANTLRLPHRGPMENGKPVPFAVVAAAGQRIALLVDEHVAEQEIMIKNLGARIESVPHIAGATILPSGRIALVLNAASLLRAAIEQTATPLVPAPVGAVRKRLLLAEDSVTTRNLIASILADAGYDVATAPDGAAAWELLQETGVDLVVSDIAMPRMDGFALTRAVRNSSRFRELPVVLLTTRETTEDKAQGAAAGANAYLVKSAFDQRDLLETIAQLL